MPGLSSDLKTDCALSNVGSVSNTSAVKIFILPLRYNRKEIRRIFSCYIPQLKKQQDSLQC